MIRPTSEFVIEYQSLLTGNESLASVKRALKLVWQSMGAQVRLSGDDLTVDWPEFGGTHAAELNYPRVPRRDIGEVNELIRATFKHSIVAANGRSQRGAQAARQAD